MREPSTPPKASVLTRMPMLGYRELAAYLRIGVRTCKRWVADGTLPAPDLRLRGIVRWHPGTIERWLIRQRRAS